MTFAVVIAMLFGFVAWLLSATSYQPMVDSRCADEGVLHTLRARYVSGDLDRDDYERLLRVLGE